MRIAALALSAVCLAFPAMAGSSDHKEMDHTGMAHGSMDHADMDGVHTPATINSIDGVVVNVSHPPIPALRWPAMTMDLMLLEGAEVGDVEPGDEAMLMLEKGEDGMVGIRAMTPAE